MAELRPVAEPEAGDDVETEEVSEEARPQRDQRRPELCIGESPEPLGQADVEDEERDGDRDDAVTEREEARIGVALGFARRPLKVVLAHLISISQTCRCMAGPA